MAHDIKNIHLEITPQNSEGYSIFTLHCEINDKEVHESIAVLTSYIKQHSDNKKFQSDMVRQVLHKLMTDLLAKQYTNLYKAVDTNISIDKILKDI